VIARYAIVPLGEAHDKTGFDCGVSALNHYLQTQAGQDSRRHIANCFVAVADGFEGIAGYYTLSAASIALGDLGEDVVKRLPRLPRYPVIPAARIGRLAIDRRHQRQGLGGAMLFDASARALRSDAAIFAVLVDAKNDETAAFYRHHGFTPLAGHARTLYLPIATVKKA
jgi:GNAT superfamily N-acetyltransferase